MGVGKNTGIRKRVRKTNTSCGNRRWQYGLAEEVAKEKLGKGRGGGETRENFQARRRNYIGSEWNISSGALHPTKTRKTGGGGGGLCNQPRRRFYPFVLDPHPPLVRIINGQFAASAADCIVSLFSGPPSGWQAVFPLSRILPSLRLSPVFRLSPRVVFPLVPLLQSTFRPFHYPGRVASF